MKPTKRPIITGFLILAFAAALAAGWLTADAPAPPQETTGAPGSTSEEPLPDFQPSERLPADSAVAFPTDI
jgi:hypothetical protein